MATGKLKRLAPIIAPAKDRLASVGEGMGWRQGKATAAARGYDHQWRVARLEHLRVNPWCKRCAEHGRLYVPAVVVDHIRPHRGDMQLFWDRTNWQGLCKRCHSKHKQQQEQREATAASNAPIIAGRARGAFQAAPGVGLKSSATPSTIDRPSPHSENKKGMKS